MKISYIKIAIKFLFGGKEGVLDYLLDLANSAVALLPQARKDRLAEIIAFLNKLLGLSESLVTWCPAKWRKAWLQTSLALAAVVNAAEDLQVTKTELADVIDKFRLAYAEWRTDDDSVGGSILADLAKETESAK